MDVDGENREFDAQLMESWPDQRVAWQTTGVPLLAEAITLKKVAADRCEVIAELEDDAMLLLASDDRAQESLSRRLRADLTQLKELLEQQVGPVHAI
jgi:hypothetical protein